MEKLPDLTQDDTNNLICQQCEENRADLYCLVCGSELCKSEVCKDKHEDKCRRYDTLPGK